MGGDWYGVDYATLQNGQYEYIIRVQDDLGNPVDLTGIGGNADGTLTGSVNILRGADAMPTVDQATSSAIAVPITTLHYDVFGNVVQQTRYAGSSGNANANGYNLPGTNPDDQTRYRFYDSFGHEIRTVDANGHSVYSAFNAIGQQVKEWQSVTDADGTIQNKVTYQNFDALGRLKASNEVIDGQVATPTLNTMPSAK